MKIDLNNSRLSVLFLISLIISSIAVHGQSQKTLKFGDSTFPGNWDKNRDLRGRNGVVLAWTHTRSSRNTESKSCIKLVAGLDSAGKAVYFISEMYSDKKPFNKWHHSWRHYSPNYSDTASKMQFGYFDTHIERFDHKPTEKELYELLMRWEFSLFGKDFKTIEAGADGKLWLETFGFIPDRKIFIDKE